ATASGEIAEPGHDALRPRRRRVQPRQIVGPADDAFILEFVQDEIAVHRCAVGAENAAGQESVDADALGGVFARDPVRPVGVILWREIAPDGEIAGSLHATLPLTWARSERPPAAPPAIGRWPAARPAWRRCSHRGRGRRSRP